MMYLIKGHIFKLLKFIGLCVLTPDFTTLCVTSSLYGKLLNRDKYLLLATQKCL